MPVPVELSNLQYAAQSATDAYIRVIEGGKGANPYDDVQDAAENALRKLYMAAYADVTAEAWECTLDQLVQLGASKEYPSLYTAHYNTLNYLAERKQDRATEELSRMLSNDLDAIAVREGMDAEHVLMAINDAISGEGTYKEALHPLAQMPGRH